MQLFYAPQITLPLYTLPADESAHAVRVLRLGVGEPVQLTDGKGTMYMARIVQADPKACVVEVALTMPAYGKLPYSLTVAMAPTKNIDRFEWFLEKATEVGIDRVIPLECERSERRVLKHEHSAKVIAGAMKQSIKAYLPVLDELTPFAAALQQPFDGVKLIAHCIDGRPRRSIGDCIEPGRPVLVLIGPEGDFSPAEVEAAVAAGFTEITLGSQRLRTETAGLAAVFAMHYLAGK
jgi:16S rRNA (uracil1498-N3)-methyltransferase